MIVSTLGTCSGEPRIDGHRITVKNVLGLLFETDEGINEILGTFNSLSREDVNEVKDYLYELLDKETDKPIFCKNCGIRNCEEPCEKYCEELTRINSYKEGISLGQETIMKIVGTNYKSVLEETVKDMVTEETEPCGFSFNFDAWWKGFFDTIENKYPNYIYQLKKFKRDEKKYR